MRLPKRPKGPTVFPQHLIQRLRCSDYEWTPHTHTHDFVPPNRVIERIHVA